MHQYNPVRNKTILKSFLQFFLHMNLNTEHFCCFIKITKKLKEKDRSSRQNYNLMRIHTEGKCR